MTHRRPMRTVRLNNSYVLPTHPNPEQYERLSLRFRAVASRLEAACYLPGISQETRITMEIFKVRMEAYERADLPMDSWEKLMEKIEWYVPCLVLDTCTDKKYRGLSMESHRLIKRLDALHFLPELPRKLATAVTDYLVEVIDKILERIAEDSVVWLELMDEIKALTADALEWCATSTFLSRCMGANQDFVDTFLRLCDRPAMAEDVTQEAELLVDAVFVGFRKRHNALQWRRHRRTAIRFMAKSLYCWVKRGDIGFSTHSSAVICAMSTAAIHMECTAIIEACTTQTLSLVHKGIPEASDEWRFHLKDISGQLDDILHHIVVTEHKGIHSSFMYEISKLALASAIVTYNGERHMPLELCVSRGINTILENRKGNRARWIALKTEIEAQAGEVFDRYLHDSHPTLLLDSKRSIRGLIETTDRPSFPRHGLTTVIPIIKRVTKAIHDKVPEGDNVWQTVMREADAQTGCHNLLFLGKGQA